jgi:hypothetical protein
MTLKKILILESEQNFVSICGKQFNNFEYIFIKNFIETKTKLQYIFSLIDKCDAVLSIHYDNPYINVAIFYAKTKDKKTILVIDGPLEWTNLYKNPNTNDIINFRPIIHDFCFTLSEKQIRYLKFGNSNVIFDVYKNFRATMQFKTHSPQYDFLITTSNTPYFNDYEKKQLILLLQSIIDAAIEMNLSLLLRLKPEIINKINNPKMYINDIESDISNLLSKVKSVIVSPSTVALQAMQNSLPTGMLIYRNSPITYSTGWILYHGADHKITLKEMLDPELSRMEYQSVAIASETSTSLLVTGLEKLEHISSLNNSHIDFFERNVWKILNSRWNFNLFKQYLQVQKFYRFTKKCLSLQ